MKTEFDKDMHILAEHLLNKDTSNFRRQIARMFGKMQMTNTKAYYVDKIDKLCKLVTEKSYEELFLLGIN